MHPAYQFLARLSQYCPWNICVPPELRLGQLFSNAEWNTFLLWDIYLVYIYMILIISGICWNHITVSLFVWPSCFSIWYTVKMLTIKWGFPHFIYVISNTFNIFQKTFLNFCFMTLPPRTVPGIIQFLKVILC